MAKHYVVQKTTDLKLKVEVPADKSISHRALMLSSLAEGTSVISNLLESDDCLHTLDIFRHLGIEIIKQGNGDYVVYGKGLHGLTKSDSPLDVGNSGTAMRLMLGILCAQNFESVISGDESVAKRPMSRVTNPLMALGAKFKVVIDARKHLLFSGDDARGEITVCASTFLRGFYCLLPGPSAQVKSAMLLAGLYTRDHVLVKETIRSRDHSEIMLANFGANISIETLKGGRLITMSPGSWMTGQTVIIPGDISSAAFFIVAGLIIPGGSVVISNVGVNDLRIGLVSVLRSMGGDITFENERLSCGEKVADIRVNYSRLHGVEINGDIIPALIDELPVIAVAAAFAEGVTVVSDAAELRVKETDRIATTVSELSKFRVDISEKDDGFTVVGSDGSAYLGARINSFKDHRIAMSAAIMGLCVEGETIVDDVECVATSFPGFDQLFEGLIRLND
jgi:3-phosphoshikimate 1-carboxyvinyltransferase